MTKDRQGLPKHIGIIMDGNGRWAVKRGLPRRMGHKQGAAAFERMCKYCRKLGIPFVTVYAFSTENWLRPAEEVDAVMDLLRDYLKRTEKHREENVRVLFLGDRTPLAPDIIKMMEKTERDSAQNKGLTVSIAVNYGGRQELTQAVQRLARDCVDGKRVPETLTEDDVSEMLYTAGMPDVDLMIRPSGEQRTSNFLPWQSTYAELVFLDVLWPDFTEKHLDEALRQYGLRDRRFGGL